jgi:hypothetical protein
VLLRRGITGFWDATEVPLAFVDIPGFRGHCYEVARQIGGRVVVDINPNSHSVSSFVVIVLDTKYREVAALLHSHLPVIAFAATPIIAGVPLQFLDCLELARAFSNFGMYEVTSASELERPFSQDDLIDLSDAELAQVKYWKPRRIGDVAFNYWD